MDQGGFMCNVAYTIATAATSAGLTEDIIIGALKDRSLVARQLEGQVVICEADLRDWLDGLPVWD